MKRKKSKSQKQEINRDYFRSLNSLVDRLFSIAAKEELTWTQIAEISGLTDGTIRRLGNRQTKFPQLRTIELLANAFGGRIDYIKGIDRKALVISWTPKMFAGRRKVTKLKIA